MWPDKDIAYVKLKDDQLGSHFGLFVNDDLISVISIFESGGSIQFRKFATLSNLQGRGYGTILLQFVIEETKRRGAKILWCNARKSKMNFYKRFGLEGKDKAVTKDGIEYVIMSMKF
jgi:GNAT superfamily N-acetyltransferase